MSDIERYSAKLNSIRGKTIAIVYIFEREDAVGYSHYEIWKSDVICSWLMAIQELKCVPFILDARTFISKAMNGTLPIIDYVINLNNGNYTLSTLGLIPSVCSFLGIPCIPCGTLSTVVGESKVLSNKIASFSGLNTPKDGISTTGSSIVRPNNLGSSIGVKLIKGDYKYSDNEGPVQEFIPGFDMTTPILYNPILEHMEVLQPVMYYPNACDVNWFLGEKEKEEHSGYQKVNVIIEEDTKQLYLNLALSLEIQTFCRIDARVKCTSEEMEQFRVKTIPSSRVYFLEINPLPTVKDGINFHTSLEHLSDDVPMYRCLSTYKNIVSEYSLTGFILSCSMLAIIDTKAKH